MRSVKNEKGYQVSVLNSKVCVCGEYIRPSCYLELIFLGGLGYRLEGPSLDVGSRDK